MSECNQDGDSERRKTVRKDSLNVAIGAAVVLFASLAFLIVEKNLSVVSCVGIPTGIALAFVACALDYSINSPKQQ